MPNLFCYVAVPMSAKGNMVRATEVRRVMQVSCLLCFALTCSPRTAQNSSIPSNPQYTAKSAVETSERGAFVRVIVTAQNFGDTAIVLAHNTCPMSLRAVTRTPMRSYSWDQNQWRGQLRLVCKDRRIRVQVPAHGIAAIADSISVRLILGDTLPEGMYNFEVDLLVQDPPSRLSAGRVFLTRSVR